MFWPNGIFLVSQYSVSVSRKNHCRDFSVSFAKIPQIKRIEELRGGFIYAMYTEIANQVLHAYRKKIK